MYECLFLYRHDWRQGAIGRLAEAVDELAMQLVPDGSDGQVERAARNFALLAYAGGQAEACGILPSSGRGYWLSVVQEFFGRWIEERGGSGPAEEYRLLRKVRELIERFGASRFTQVNAIPSEEEARVQDRLGYWREVKGRTQWLFTADTFLREFHMKPQYAANILRRYGWLLPDDSKG